MKKLILSLTAALVFCASAVSAPGAIAQCVQCKPSALNPNRLVCTSSTTGGKECVTEGQTLCAIVTACGGTTPRPEEPEHIGGGRGRDGARVSFARASFHPCMFSQVDDDKAGDEVEVAPDTLKAIGATHPRFAVALAFLRKHGHLGKDATVYMVPVEVSLRDVERWLSPNPDPAASVEDIFKSFDSKAQASDLQNAPTVTYAFTFKKSPAQARAILKLRVVEGFASDPSYTALELDLAEAGGAPAGSKKWKVSAWRVK